MESAANAVRDVSRVLLGRKPVRFESRFLGLPPKRSRVLDSESVMLSTTMNTGHVHGLAAETIVLPVLARDEEPEPTTQESMFNYVRLSDGGPRRGYRGRAARSK